MNGVHDLGGMQGFGPIRREENEPVFQFPWEGRVFGMSIALGAHGIHDNLALGHRGANADEYPSPRWRQRCQHRQIVVSPSHPDFALLLAEALDVLARHDWQPPRAAEQLDCSTSQLIKFLRRDPRGLSELNRRRCEAGLTKLH